MLINKMKTYLRWEAYHTVRMHSTSLIPIKKYKVKVPSRGLSNLTLLAGTARPLIIIVLDFS